MQNNLLAALNWAIEKDEPLHGVLKGLSSKRIRVVFPVGDAHLDWAIEADGLLKEINLKGHDAPDVIIYIGTNMVRGLRIEGDAAVAEKLGPLSDLIKKRLSPWEQFWEHSPFANLARQVADYAMYESNIIISRQQAQDHHESLRQFRDSLDRFEKRLDQVEKSRS